jgi:hypothetical protein
VNAVVRTLARYMRDNPHACDSADGIRRWWFADGYAVTADELEKALTWMKQRGLIDEAVAADGRVRFRRRGSDAQLDAAAQARNGDPAGTP